MLRAIITHCGSEIVTGDERGLAAKPRGIGIECGLEAHIAHDGMELILRRTRVDTERQKVMRLR